MKLKFLIFAICLVGIMLIASFAAISFYLAGENPNSRSAGTKLIVEDAGESKIQIESGISGDAIDLTSKSSSSHNSGSSGSDNSGYISSGNLNGASDTNPSIQTSGFVEDKV